MYSDEIPVDGSANAIDTNRPGALICRSEDRAGVSWHYVDGLIVRSGTSDTYRAITTGEGVTPSVSQILLNRENAEIMNPNLNGVWHCRLNAMGHRDNLGATFDQQINVGIFSRGEGKLLRG